MARVKYSSIVSHLSGSIGSATFQRSRSGNIVRNRPRSTGTPSQAQLARRGIMQQLHFAWSNLTDDQRFAWDKFIDFSGASIRRDKSIKLTGHSLFIQYNFLRMITGFSIMTEFDYIPLSGIPVVNSLGLEADNMIVFHSGIFDVSKLFFSLKLTSPRPPSQAFNPRGLRTITSSKNTGAAQDIGASYKSIFGFLPLEGDTVHFENRVFSMVSPVISGVMQGKMIIFVHEP